MLSIGQAGLKNPFLAGQALLVWYLPVANCTAQSNWISTPDMRRANEWESLENLLVECDSRVSIDIKWM